MIMAPVVRRASVDDAEVISSLNADVQALHARAFPWRFKPPGPTTFTPSDVATILVRPEHMFFVAELDGQPAGYAFAEVVRRPESPMHHAYDMMHLHHISVRPQHRRRGVGNALMDAVRGAGEELGITLVGLDVWTFNQEARAFFARQGFTPYNERLWNR
jgi:ribosomal protein S18 acetylase RimI-like enzyme